MKVRFTNFTGQARIFAKRETASKWAKKCKGTILKINGVGFFVSTDNGWVKCK